jgi:malonyl-CoA O-methyltransferase
MQISSRHLSALQPNAINIVLIHGWGTSSIIWDEWLPLLRQHCHVTLIDLPGYGDSPAIEHIDLEELLLGILIQAPEKAVYLGYSLGGMLAVKMAELYPERVSAIVTFASNLRFVASEQWPLAMDKMTYQAFYTLVKDDPKRALKRFVALQSSGAKDEKQLMKTLRSKSEDISKEGLLSSLDLLFTLDNTTAKYEKEALHVLGEKDSLVPAAIENKLTDNSSTSVEVLNDSPHSFFVSDPGLSWEKVFSFLNKKQLIKSVSCRVLDKHQVARSFSRAANSYDSVADLQRRVGRQLLETLPDISADVVLDLGCGTGFFTPQLQKQYPESTVVGLDLAEGMVAYAASHKSSRHWLCADAELLPLADNSIDVIFSSLAIQWCEDTEGLFSEIFRVLKPAGYFVFSTLGPNTLHELKKAWRAVDDYVHVNKFVDKTIIESAVKNTGFIENNAELVLTEDIITLQYSSLKQLTRELKSLGAHNVNNGRPSGLTGKHRMQQFINGYEQQRNSNNYLPASYQAWYGCLQKIAEETATTEVPQQIKSYGR